MNIIYEQKSPQTWHHHQNPCPDHQTRLPIMMYGPIPMTSQNYSLKLVILWCKVLVFRYSKISVSINVYGHGPSTYGPHNVGNISGPYGRSEGALGLIDHTDEWWESVVPY